MKKDVHAGLVFMGWAGTNEVYKDGTSLRIFVRAMLYITLSVHIAAVSKRLSFDNHLTIKNNYMMR